MSQCAHTDGRCQRCEGPLPFDFTMAFQPIVDLATANTYAYEALVRGLQGETAYSILSQVTPKHLYRFDQACRVKAIEMASKLGMEAMLSINFLPNAVYEPEACIQATLAISNRVGWPTDRIIFEITETEQVKDRDCLKKIIAAYRDMGFKTALDDFGSGYANLDLLTELSPHKLKIDRQLVKHCDRDKRRQALLRAIVTLGEALDITLIAEGVETRGEALWLAGAGINYQQGFYYARPVINSLGADLTPLLTSLRDEVSALTRPGSLYA